MLGLFIISVGNFVIGVIRGFISVSAFIISVDWCWVNIKMPRISLLVVLQFPLLINSFYFLARNKARAL